MLESFIMVKILDGKKLSEKIAKDLRAKISALGKIPTLAIIQIGNEVESGAYIARKKAFGASIGAKIHHIELSKDVKQNDILDLIYELNFREDINGIIVQLPMPKHIDRYAVMEAIDPKKDVDGLHSKNAGLLYERAFGGKDPKNVPEGILPATAKGIITLLKSNKVSLSGKNVLVIGRSLLVGKPVAMLMLKENATVTIAHSKTKNIKKIIKDFDVVIVAVGKAHFLGKESFRKGQIVVDVGTNAIKGPKILEETHKRKLVGDVKFGEVSKIVQAISPVPGGVGPMTVASLFENLVQASVLQK